MKPNDELAAEMDASIKNALSLGELKIHYDAASDTLSLWNGIPAGYGEMVSKDLTAESNADGEVVGITLERAAEMLRPHLFPESAKGKVKESANLDS